jgi:hypothetical protein
VEGGREGGRRRDEGRREGRRRREEGGGRWSGWRGLRYGIGRFNKNRRKLRGVSVTGRCRGEADDALGWTMMGVGDVVTSLTALRKSRNVR